MISSLRSLGMTSDLAYGLGFASIIGSIATWATARSSDDRAHAERFGIFVGLWPPTFMLIANALKQEEQK